MIRNIIFDMGGVMIRFDRDFFLDRLGLAGEDKSLLMREVFLSLEWAMMDRGSLTDEQAAQRICQRVPERLHDSVHKLVSMWDRPILEIDGMYKLTEELKGLGYGIYLLSNASCRQHEYWPRVPASKFFDGTLISCDVKLVKPQPEIYLLLLQTFGLRAEECFFIDDSPLNIEGARWSGLNGTIFHNDISLLRRDLLAAGVPVSQL